MGLRPLSLKLSAIDISCSNSCLPLRIVSRFYPSSLSAIVCPPKPKLLTTSAINCRRSLPFNFWAVFIYKDLRLSVNWIKDSEDMKKLQANSLFSISQLRIIYYLQYSYRTEASSTKVQSMMRANSPAFNPTDNWHWFSSCLNGAVASPKNSETTSGQTPDCQ